MNLDFTSLFTSRDGRINRARFWVGAICILLVWMMIYLIFGSSVFGRILELLAAIGLFYPAYAVAAKRFQDRDRPGQTALLGLVPVLIAIMLYTFGLTGEQTGESPAGVNAVGWIGTLVYLGVGLWFAIELGALKGTPGSNRFGGDPLSAVG